MRRDWSKPRPPPGTRTIIWKGERFRLELEEPPDQFTSPKLFLIVRTNESGNEFEIVVPKYEALGVGPRFYDYGLNG